MVGVYARTLVDGRGLMLLVHCAVALEAELGAAAALAFAAAVGGLSRMRMDALMMPDLSLIAGGRV